MRGRVLRNITTRIKTRGIVRSNFHVANLQLHINLNGLSSLAKVEYGTDVLDMGILIIYREHLFGGENQDEIWS